MRKISPLLILCMCAVITGCCVDYSDDSGGYRSLRFRDLKIRLGDSLGRIYKVHYVSPVNHTDTMNTREFVVKEPVEPSEFSMIIFSDLGYDTAHFLKKKARIEINKCDVEGTYEFFSLSGHTFDSIKDIDLPRNEYYYYSGNWNPYSTIIVY